MAKIAISDMCEAEQKPIQHKASKTGSAQGQVAQWKEYVKKLGCVSQKFPAEKIYFHG